MCSGPSQRTVVRDLSMSDDNDFLRSVVKYAFLGAGGFVVYQIGRAVGASEEGRVGQDNLEKCSRDFWKLRDKVEAMGTPQANALAAQWNQAGWKPRQIRANPSKKQPSKKSRRR